MQKLSNRDGKLTVLFCSSVDEKFDADKMLNTMTRIDMKKGDDVELEFEPGGYKHILIESSDKKYRLYDLDTMFGVALTEPDSVTINGTRFVVLRTVNQLGGKITMTIK